VCGIAGILALSTQLLHCQLVRRLPSWSEVEFTTVIQRFTE
jgi:hypothetical protein